jgi:hypothetical protein
MLAPGNQNRIKHFQLLAGKPATQAKVDPSGSDIFQHVVKHTLSTAKNVKVPLHISMPWESDEKGLLYTTESEKLLFRINYLRYKLNLVAYAKGHDPEKKSTHPDTQFFKDWGFMQPLHNPYQIRTEDMTYTPGQDARQALWSQLVQAEADLAIIEAESQYRRDLARWILGAGPDWQYDITDWVDKNSTGEKKLEQKEKMKHMFPSLTQGLVKSAEIEATMKPFFIKYLLGKIPENDEEAHLYYKYCILGKPMYFEHLLDAPITPAPPAPPAARVPFIPPHITRLMRDPTAGLAPSILKDEDDDLWEPKQEEDEEEFFPTKLETQAEQEEFAEVVKDYMDNWLHEMNPEYLKKMLHKATKHIKHKMSAAERVKYMNFAMKTIEEFKVEEGGENYEGREDLQAHFEQMHDELKNDLKPSLLRRMGEKIGLVKPETEQAKIQKEEEQQATEELNGIINQMKETGEVPGKTSLAAMAKRATVKIAHRVEDPVVRAEAMGIVMDKWAEEAAKVLGDKYDENAVKETISEVKANLVKNAKTERVAAQHVKTAIEMERAKRAATMKAKEEENKTTAAAEKTPDAEKTAADPTEGKKTFTPAYSEYLKKATAKPATMAALKTIDKPNAISKPKEFVSAVHTLKKEKPSVKMEDVNKLFKRDKTMTKEQVQTMKKDTAAVFTEMGMPPLEDHTVKLTAEEKAEIAAEVEKRSKTTVKLTDAEKAEIAEFTKTLNSKKPLSEEQLKKIASKTVPHIEKMKTQTAEALKQAKAAGNETAIKSYINRFAVLSTMQVLACGAAPHVLPYLVSSVVLPGVKALLGAVGLNSYLVDGVMAANSGVVNVIEHLAAYTSDNPVVQEVEKAVALDAVYKYGPSFVGGVAGQAVGQAGVAGAKAGFGVAQAAGIAGGAAAMAGGRLAVNFLVGNVIPYLIFIYTGNWIG